MSTQPEIFVCERCQRSWPASEKFHLWMRPLGVASLASAHLHVDLCPSCAREAKQWVSEKPPKPSTIHHYPTVNNRGGTL